MRPSSFRTTSKGGAIALATLLFLLLATPASAALTPESAESANAESMRTAYWVMLFIIVVIGIPAIGGLLFAARKFRARGRDAQPRRLAAGRGSIGRVAATLAAVATGIFIFGIVMTEETRNASAETEGEAIDIKAVGQQWLWRYEYPAQAGGSASEGIATVFSYNELVVPVDTKVNLTIDSTDVLHTWFVPALGPQVMAVPGEISELTFRADSEGVYQGQSTQFAGTNTPELRIWVRVVSQEEYEDYVSELGEDLAAGQEAVQEELDAAPPDGAEELGQLQEESEARE